MSFNDWMSRKFPLLLSTKFKRFLWKIRSSFCLTDLKLRILNIFSLTFTHILKDSILKHYANPVLLSCKKVKSTLLLHVSLIVLFLRWIFFIVLSIAQVTGVLFVNGFRFLYVYRLIKERLNLNSDFSILLTFAFWARKRE